MNLEIRLPSEDIITVEFEYLKIKKHCFVCFSLFHEEMDCPSKPRYLPPPKERKLGITQRIALQRIEAEKKRHDDRRGKVARSPLKTLKALKLRKTTASRSLIPPRKKGGNEKDSNLPCNKATLMSWNCRGLEAGDN
uniref:Zinc knuckle CX2CX4HX4C domain-containing protein n=1 Tax=Brassica oleracea TaxID=3712 RepID=A0A3P6E0M5_BRAOL|nr:unnamed protein product [Brassica oleracea]